LTQTIAACNSTGLATKPIIQFTSPLTVCLLSDAIPQEDCSVGSGVVAMAYIPLWQHSEHRSREDRVCLVCMSGSVEDEHYFLFDCPPYSHIRQQYSHLFHQASTSVAAFLATDQPNVVGGYLKTCVSQRQSFLANPPLAWLLNFLELDQCGACGVAVLAPSFITTSPQQFLWCSIVKHLLSNTFKHLMLSVCCFPSYCVLTLLMSPQDKKCKLID